MPQQLFRNLRRVPRATFPFPFPFLWLVHTQIPRVPGTGYPATREYPGPGSTDTFVLLEQSCSNLHCIEPSYSGRSVAFDQYLYLLGKGNCGSKRVAKTVPNNAQNKKKRFFSPHFFRVPTEKVTVGMLFVPNKGVMHLISLRLRFLRQKSSLIPGYRVPEYGHTHAGISTRTSHESSQTFLVLTLTHAPWRTSKFLSPLKTHTYRRALCAT
eukprot:3700377-Rhodomonas_salina.1